MPNVYKESKWPQANTQNKYKRYKDMKNDYDLQSEALPHVLEE